jgi:uncharacterized integral membrane protein (TIGR00698 family)
MITLVNRVQSEDTKIKRESRKDLIFGLIVLALMTYLAYGLAGGIQDRLAQNPVLIAVLFGIFVGNVFGVPQFMQPAINFTTAYLIKTAVVLIGLKVSFQVILSIGPVPVLIAIGEILSVFFAAYFFLSKIMRFDREFSILIAAGSSICGAAAVMAAASVVRAQSKLITLSVTIITLMGTFQLFLYPYLYHQGSLVGFNDQLFGYFAGAGIYEFAQVYGVGYAVSDTALSFATLVKLIKVMMLIPMILLIQHFYYGTEQEKTSRSQIKKPWFILFFLLMVILNSTFTIHSTVKFVVSQLGTSLFLMAMVALGLKTNLRTIWIEHNVRKLMILAAFITSFTTLVTYFYTLASTIDVQQAAQASQTPLASNHSLEQNHYGGREIFTAIGCAKCHVESLPTKSGSSLLLYSDLLLHDMGPALNDQIIQSDARGVDWRTTPLVGIGNRTHYLHDGRALTYRDAIVAHGGEAKIVRDRFIDLPQKEKEAIYAFLDKLQ